jgi:hypothetical protein
MLNKMPIIPGPLAEHIALRRVVGSKEAAAYCNLSISHWRVLVREGLAPPPVLLSKRKFGWRISTLVGFVDPLGRIKDTHSHSSRLPSFAAGR